MQIADAVNYLHLKGLSHNDLKLENVLIHEGNCLVADFGLLTRRELTYTHQELDHTNGTITYLAPELF